MTHQCLKIKVKLLTFHHKNMFIVFNLNTQVDTWYSNEKKLMKF